MKRSRLGFTLMELVIAVSITTVMGMAVAGVTLALAKGQEHSQGRYQSLQQARSAMLAVQAAIRKARLVTGATAHSIIVWVEDADGDGTANFSELAVIELDQANSRIVYHRNFFPDTMGDEMQEALDYVVALGTMTDAPAAVIDALTGTMYTQSRILATEVTDFGISTVPAPPLTEMITIKLTVGEEGRGITLRSAVSIRAIKTDTVGVDDDGYVWMPDDDDDDDD